MGLIRKVLNKRGSTIVEVMVACVILGIVCVMFSEAMQASLNIVKRSQEINRFNADAFLAYYNSDPSLEKKDLGKITFNFSIETDSFFVEMDLKGNTFKKDNRSVTIVEYNVAE